jgi:hypothetical protein
LSGVRTRNVERETGKEDWQALNVDRPLLYILTPIPYVPLITAN